jgi:hypothetical protein
MIMPLSRREAAQMYLAKDDLEKFYKSFVWPTIIEHACLLMLLIEKGVVTMEEVNAKMKSLREQTSESIKSNGGEQREAENTGSVEPIANTEIETDSKGE